MSTLTRDSYVKLVRLDLTPSNQLTFQNENMQKQFFDNLNGLVLEDFSYQRKDKVIRYPRSI